MDQPVVETISPRSVPELQALLADHHQRRARVAPVSLNAIEDRFEHGPEDMTATVSAGIEFQEFQDRLARRGQWLPLDPPGAGVTVGSVLLDDMSGPRRFGFGTVREHVIGITAVLADGELISSGGKVVKNVAGFDLAKLFIGSRGTIGFIVEATFKLRPRPARELFLKRDFPSAGHALVTIGELLDSELSPSVVDLIPASAPPYVWGILGFSGTEKDVAFQAQQAEKMGFVEPADLSHELAFWRKDESPVHRLSVLPSMLAAALNRLQPDDYVARAGNGIIYHRGAAQPPLISGPRKLNQRVKQIFDPHGVLPDADFTR